MATEEITTLSASDEWSRQLETTFSASSIALSSADEPYGNYGAMFYVKAIFDVTITALDFYGAQVEAGVPVQLYGRPGKYVGHETNSTGWTLVYDNASLELFGRTSPASLSGLNINIPPGQFHSFVLWSPNRKIMYNPGTVEETVYSSNAYIEFYEGVGVQSLFNGDPTTLSRPRILRGELNFDVKFTGEPSAAPSLSLSPSAVPSAIPSQNPTLVPSRQPSLRPSSQPSSSPSAI
eukprot:scaffold11326_cov144-Skeletonema_menzelii.AAC.1